MVWPGFIGLSIASLPGTHKIKKDRPKSSLFCQINQRYLVIGRPLH